MVETRA